MVTPDGYLAAAAAPSSRSSGRRSPPVGRDRRIVGQALSYWHDLRGNRPLPRLSDIAMEGDPILDGKLFLLDVSTGVEDCRFIYEGGCLSEAFQCSTRNGTLHEMLPSDVADHLMDMVRAVVDFRRPLADAATLPRVRGGGVLMHRMVVMPVTESDDKVTHVLGAYSYKVD